MAIVSITVSQDNKSGLCDLLSVHNPLVFLIDVVYSGTAPDDLYVELQDDESTVLNTFYAIPYDDLGTTRTFYFTAAEMIRAYMDDIDDFESEDGVLEFVNNITKIFTLRFYIGTKEDTVTFTAIHAAEQYGGNPALESIYNNEDTNYYTGAGMPVYLYFYNADEDNIINIDDPDVDEVLAVDYDDTLFLDSDDITFKIL